MSACYLGPPNTQIMSSKVVLKSTHSLPFPPNTLHLGSWPKAWMCTHMTMSQRSNKVSKICCAQSSLTADGEPVTTSRLEKGGGEKKFRAPVSQLIPKSNEVMSLLSDICDTTSIAEFELKLDGFHLHVTKALSPVVTDPQPPPPRPPSAVSTSAGTSTSSFTTSKEPDLSDQVSTSLAITKSGPLGIKSRALLERAADEGLVIIQSPKVGFFRRCRTIKGKRAPPASKEKQLVKEGQVICYIEQLGWEAPIESDVSGEVTKFLCEDGEPVGFGDPIIAILPSFPGIKKLSAES